MEMFIVVIYPWTRLISLLDYDVYYNTSPEKDKGSERPRKVPKASLNIWSASNNLLSCSGRMEMFIVVIYPWTRLISLLDYDVYYNTTLIGTSEYLFFVY
jgi:L-ribulose-5-phosphate 3-epimerase UlaE